MPRGAEGIRPDGSCRQGGRKTLGPAPRHRPSSPTEPVSPLSAAVPGPRPPGPLSPSHGTVREGTATDPGVPPGPSVGPGEPERLRIAFFTDSFVPTHDGVANETDSVARALVGLGHEVTVFTVRTPGTLRNERREDGVRVRRYVGVPAPGYPQYRIALFPWGAAFAARGRFDVVHVHTPGFVGLAGWLAGRGAKLPLLATYHTDLAELLRGAGRHRGSRAFFRAWGRFGVDLCRTAQLATAPTDAGAAALAPRPGARTSAPVWVVENGVEPERFRPGITAPDWGARLAPSRPPFVLFLGRLTRDKGVHRFLDAVDRLDLGPPWTALIGGDGPQRGAVENHIAARRGRISHLRYLGPVAESEKPALLAQSSIFVLPSLSDTSSVALLEAMAAGAVGVVTTRGGPGEIARRSGCGLVVDPEDAGAIAAAIQRLLRDPAEASDHARRGRAWVVEEASSVRTARGYLHGYRRILRPGTPR